MRSAQRSIVRIDRSPLSRTIRIFLCVLHSQRSNTSRTRGVARHCVSMTHVQSPCTQYWSTEGDQMNDVSVRSVCVALPMALKVGTRSGPTTPESKFLLQLALSIADVPCVSYINPYSEFAAHTNRSRQTSHHVSPHTGYLRYRMESHIHSKIPTCSTKFGNSRRIAHANSASSCPHCILRQTCRLSEVSDEASNR